jgi:hypothetical protein
MSKGRLITFAASSALIVGLAMPALAASPRQLPRLAARTPKHDAYGLDVRRAVGVYDLSPPPLKAATAYTAGFFPLALRVTPPDGSWLGGQGQSFAGRTQSPAFGWIELLSSRAGRPRGAIFAVTSYGHTPSVAATVAGLRSRGAGATYQAATSVRLVGFSGTQFDGTVVGPSHTFVPFSPPVHVAAFFPDAFKLYQGEVFRIVVLNVKGKTIVFFLENATLPAGQFPAFLSSANRILGSLGLAS